MKQKVSPTAIGVIVAIAVVLLGVVGFKTFSAPTASESKPTVVKVENPNDPKFQVRLPQGMAGGQ